MRFRIHFIDLLYQHPANKYQMSFDTCFRPVPHAIGEKYNKDQSLHKTIADKLTYTELMKEYGEMGPRNLLFIYIFSCFSRQLYSRNMEKRGGGVLSVYLYDAAN
jgi:hypothetical protein